MGHSKKGAVKESDTCNRATESENILDVSQMAFTEISNSKSNTHSNTKNDGRPYRCEVCPCSYTLKGSLTRHMKVHAETKPQPCVQNQKDQKRFQCDICTLTFSSKSKLTKDHMNIHKKIKPYQNFANLL